MKTIKAKGLKFAVHDSGQGRPVLLVHGFPLHHAMWSAQIEALTPRCRVIAPDLRGFGESEAAGDVVTMDMFADDLAVILDALEIEEPVCLCGFSMGGYIAFAFWRKYASRVRSMILPNTRPSADTPEAADGRRKMADRVLAEGSEPLIESMIGKMFAPDTPKRDPALVRKVRAMMEANSREGVAATLRGLADRADVTAMLPRMDVPALVIVGSEDQISTPKEMSGMAKAIPRAKFVEIPGAGHMAPMEKPREFCDALTGPAAGVI
jgi:pimeloyl-ACP methyl ester carboxylesterase